MGTDNRGLKKLCRGYVQYLCSIPGGRCTGTAGNRRATDFFARELAVAGWEVKKSRFNAMDWKGGRATLTVAGKKFSVQSSPYSPGCTVTSKLVCVSTVAELKKTDAKGAVLLLHGPIAAGQLMPKNFVFYNPESHREIIALLEKSKAAALVCATGRDPSVAGGVYPFPMIEDGDFDVPSVYMKDVEAVRLAKLAGSVAQLKSDAVRRASYGFNVTGTRGKVSGKRIVVTAHIDAKKGTPGAIDNATGVVIMLLLARLLKQAKTILPVELTALNGEDYYAVPGQMEYIRQNSGRFGDIALNINIDGAGLKKGKTSFSLFGLPPGMKKKVKAVMNAHPGITEGPQWPQGDHSIFIQQGCPAVAVSSKWLIDHMDSHDITHTKKDNPSIVDCRKLVEAATALRDMVTAF